MARVPISFYLSIIAGILVLFNHYTSFETGDVALNKITGAASRFYTLVRDTQHVCTSPLETAFCGPWVNSVLPHDAAEYLRVRYQCRTPARNSESVDGTSNDRQPHGGYGSSGLAFVYYRPPTRPLPRTPAKGLLRRSPFSLEGSSQSHLSRAVWDRCKEAMTTMGVLLLRTCASWWWFRAPFKMMGVLLAGYSALSALGYLFGACVVLRFTSQVCIVYVIVVVDFLRCMEWEAQRQVSDIGVVMMERAYGAVKHAHKRI